MNWESLPLVLNAKEVAEITRYSIGHIYFLLARKRMNPPPISYGRGRKLWSRDVVRAWVERRLDDVQPKPKRRPHLTVRQVPALASAADVKAVAAALLKGA